MREREWKRESREILPFAWEGAPQNKPNQTKSNHTKQNETKQNKPTNLAYLPKTNQLISDWVLSRSSPLPPPSVCGVSNLVLSRSVSRAAPPGAAA